MTTLSAHPPTSHTSGERFSWKSFVSAVARYPFSHSGQKLAYMAQCILESGAGTSLLFRDAGNPTGLKWREEMADNATPLKLVTPTEPEGVIWCSWATPEGAIEGYRRFIQRDRYRGWEAFGNDPEAYIRHLARCGYATDPRYITKVTNLFAQARELLNSASTPLSSSNGSTSQADQILIELSPDKELIVYAKAGDITISSLKSSDKAELIHFLSRHDSAIRIKASPAVNVIAEQDLQRLPSFDSSALWLQFWQSSDGTVVLLGMVKGTPVSGVKATEPKAILSFLSSQSQARTVQAANLQSSLEWLPVGQAAVQPDPDHGQVEQPGHGGHSSSNASRRPRIRWVDGCRNFSSRNGQPIDAIVLHYTTSRQLDGSIAWFKNPESEVSAHYIVGRDGEIVQLVKDSDKAWHCYGFNTTSIGIEHVAQPGDKLTPEQEQASAALLRWLIAEYRISPQRIFGHRWNPAQPGGTSCPGDLWRTAEELRAWVESIVGGGPAATTLAETVPAGIAAVHPTPSESVRRPFRADATVDWQDMNARVSRFFTVAEVTQKDRRRIPSLGSEEERNILLLAGELDRVRDQWGGAIGVTSWYRPPAINAAVGGVRDSQHILGLAADIYTMGSDGSSDRDREFEDWLDKVAWRDRALGFGVRSGRGFTHVDLRPGAIRWNY
jgi:hypothetical protein